MVGSLNTSVDAVRVISPGANPSTNIMCFIVRTTQAVEEKAHGRVVMDEDQAINEVKCPVVSICFRIVGFAVAVLCVQDTDGS